MSRSSVAWVLRADGAFNFLAGLVLLLFYRPVVALIGWPNTETPIYANVLGAALIGLSLAVWFAANHPELSRDIIFEHYRQGSGGHHYLVLGLYRADCTAFGLAFARGRRRTGALRAR